MKPTKCYAWVSSMTLSGFWATHQQSAKLRCSQRLCLIQSAKLLSVTWAIRNRLKSNLKLPQLAPSNSATVRWLAITNLKPLPVLWKWKSLMRWLFSYVRKPLPWSFLRNCQLAVTLLSHLTVTFRRTHVNVLLNVWSAVKLIFL